MINCPRTSLMNWSWLFKRRWIALYIHWINHYPVDKYLGNQLRGIDWIEIYLVDSAIHLLNNWALNYKSCMAR